MIQAIHKIQQCHLYSYFCTGVVSTTNFRRLHLYVDISEACERIRTCQCSPSSLVYDWNYGHKGHSPLCCLVLCTGSGRVWEKREFDIPVEGVFCAVGFFFQIPNSNILILVCKRDMV